MGFRVQVPRIYTKIVELIGNTSCLPRAGELACHQRHAGVPVWHSCRAGPACRRCQSIAGLVRQDGYPGGVWRAWRAWTGVVAYPGVAGDVAGALGGVSVFRMTAMSAS